MSNVKQLVDRFHKDGFIVIPNVLSREQCWALIDDYKTRLRQNNNNKIQKRMFEDSAENLNLFTQEPLLSFARALISHTQEWDDHTNQMESSNEVHVIHNNSFITQAGNNGLGGNRWHQDDSPHIYLPEGEKLPKDFRLNVLAFTANYYLTDVTAVENGPTQAIKGSHLFGSVCPPDISKWEKDMVSCVGKAGSVVCFNNQVWHRGSKNDSKTDRYITQITYAKRLVGHKFGSIMNYQMPEHVYQGVDKDTRRLMGFLKGGAYG